jgi:cytochrome o ubiquinol oxidase operon protein cyoD
MKTTLPPEVILASKKSLRRYITGFLLSLIFTITVYACVQTHIGNGHAVISTNILVGVVAVLAAAQCIVQVVFFLHLAGEERPRTRLLTFCFMLLVVAILVIGSLWIMNNLNYHMMTPTQINTYVQQQQSAGGF